MAYVGSSTSVHVQSASHSRHDGFNLGYHARSQTRQPVRQFSASSYSSPSSSSSSYSPSISQPSSSSSAGNAARFHSSQAVFHNIPGISPNTAEQARHARRMADESRANGKAKGKAKDTEYFYPISYIRGEWMKKLLDLDVGKKKIRYYLSDEVLCLGTTEAPVTSEFSRPLVYIEAYTSLHPSKGTPQDVQIYMTEYQVSWLVDQIYMKLGDKIDSGIGVNVNERRKKIYNDELNGGLKFKDIEVDQGKRVSKDTFLAMRKVCFAKDVAKFRSRCGLLPMSNGGAPDPPRPTSHTAPAVSPFFTSPSDSSSIPSLPAVTPPTPISPPVPQTTSYQSLTRAERQQRQAQQRAHHLAQHIAYQKQNLPIARLLYENLKQYGGTALACDVESWTEDADILLDLGMAWFTWRPGGGRKSGSSHYIIEETLQYRNIEIEATRDDYTLGNSRTLPRSKVAEELQRMINKMPKTGPLILVFHDASAETRYFQKLGIDPTNYLTHIPRDLTSMPPLHWPNNTDERGTDILIQDTQDLYCGWSEPSIKQINLGKACEALGIQTGKLHNAGNDALATLQVWEKLLDPNAQIEEQASYEVALEKAVGLMQVQEKPLISKPVRVVDKHVEVDLIEL